MTAAQALQLAALISAGALAGVVAYRALLHRLQVAGIYATSRMGLCGWCGADLNDGRESDWRTDPAYRPALCGHCTQIRAFAATHGRTVRHAELRADARDRM